MSFMKGVCLKLLLLLFLITVRSFAGTCIVRMSGGKVKKYGNYEQPNESTIRQQIKAMADKERGCFERSATGGCFFINLSGVGATDFTRANHTCTSLGSVLAVIREQDTYNKIIEMGREELLKADDSSWHTVGLWLGMTYDSEKHKMYPEGSFNETWGKNYPQKAKGNTKVLVVLSTAVSDPYQGLWNRPPSAKHGGVVCWKPRTP